MELYIINPENGAKIQVTDLEKAIIQAQGFQNMKTDDTDFKEYVEKQNKHWADILKQLLSIKKETESNGNGSHFEYLGFYFKAVRKLNKNDGDFFKITNNTRSIGISNYTDTRSTLTNKWNHKDFYEQASKAGYGDYDVFIMNNKTTVLPCQNELFAYKN